MICAWCAWQWSISETRVHAARELTKHKVGVYHDDFIRVQGLWQLNDTPDIATTAPPTPDDIFRAGLLALSGTQLLWKQPLDPFRASILGAVIGWDNWRKSTVIVKPETIVAMTSDDQESVLSALYKVPNLSSVVIIDHDPKLENDPKIIAFKKRVKERLPRVNCIHSHNGGYDVVPVVG